MRKDFHTIFPPSSLPHISCVHAAKEEELGDINKRDTPLSGCEVCPSVMETLPLEGQKDLPFHQSIEDKSKSGCPTVQPGEPVSWSGAAHSGEANPNTAASPERPERPAPAPPQRMQS